MDKGVAMLERNVKPLIKRIVVVFCFIILILPFTGCAYKGYSGNYVDLYTVAINSVLWNVGHSYGADRAIDSSIKVLEHDEFGRTLFTYREKYYSGTELSFSSLIILQASLNEYSYYYEDYNFLIRKQDPYAYVVEFTQEEIDDLKAINDWGTELNLGKCIKKKTLRKKQNIPIENNTITNQVLRAFNCEKNDCKIFIHLLTSDDECRFIIYGMIKIFDGDNIYFAALANSEGDVVDWLVPDSLYNYQEELRSFKQKNGWISIT